MKVDPDHIHPIDSWDPYERAQQILARHLCGWITGHQAPLEHFLVDADMILEEMYDAKIRFDINENELPKQTFL